MITVRSGRLRLGASAALASLALVVAACGGGGDSGGGGSSSSASGSGDGQAVAGAPSWCGSKKITLALADGFGDNNWRKVTSAEAQDEAKKCPSVTKYIYTDGQGNTQKAISDIRGLVAKGVDAMVVFPDAGKAVLPAIRQSYKAGVVTVPYRVFPGGTAGKDYDYFIKTDFKKAGVLWANWLVKALNGKGNVVNLGGPPANSQSLDEYAGMQSVLKDHPGIKFIGTTPYNVTNWDPAQTQKVVTAVLAKYPKIDAFTTDFGAALQASFGAFKQAGRQIPAVATEDANKLSCAWESSKSANPNFKLFTVDSQNWMSRTAVDFAVAKATGGKIPSSTDVPQKPFEDSISGAPNPVTCDKSMPGDAFMSSHLTKPQQRSALG
jgi:ribose transport system substrate-binding protein